jgi:hypothetical protein
MGQALGTIHPALIAQYCRSVLASQKETSCIPSLSIHHAP